MKVAGIYVASGQRMRKKQSSGSNERRAVLGVPPYEGDFSLKKDGAGHARGRDGLTQGDALQELERCGLAPLVVVVAADDKLEWLPPAEPGNTRRTETSLTAHLGLSFSLRCGLKAVMPLELDAAIIALADQPMPGAEQVNRLIHAYQSNPQLDYVAGIGSGCVPALFSRSMFPVLQELDGEDGFGGILSSGEFRGLLLDGAPGGGRYLDPDGLYTGDSRKAWSLEGET